MINGPFIIYFLAIFSVITCDLRIDRNESINIIRSGEGEDIILECQLMKRVGLTYSWQHNDIVISANDRIHQIGTDLHINNLSHHIDNGLYNCIAIDSNEKRFHQQMSPKIQLEIIWLKSTRIVHRLSSNKQQTNIIFSCHIDGNHIEQILWYKNDQQLHPSMSHIQMKSHKLILIRPNSNDSGNYYCLARNQIGSARSDPYNLKILENVSDTSNVTHTGFKCQGGKNADDLNRNRNDFGPTFNLRHSQNELVELLCRGKRSGKTINDNDPRQVNRKFFSINENRPALLNCDLRTVDRNTNGLVVWKKDGKHFREIDLNIVEDINLLESQLQHESGRISVNRKNGSLIISSTVPSDAGIYDCYVQQSTDNLIKMQSVDLTIIEELKFSPEPTSKVLAIGSMGKVHCKVQGTPSPQVHWIKDSHDDLPDFVEDINGTLVFKNVSAMDIGNYTCIATNRQGKISATVSISAVIAARFIQKPQSAIQVNEMESTMIHCTAIGDPKPNILWDKDGDSLNINTSDANRINILENGTLYFTEVHLDDDGLYGCTIGNSAGLKREEARLSVQLSDDTQEDSFFIARAVLITISVVFLYMILVVGLMLWCRVKRQARKNRMQLVVKENLDTFTGNDARLNDESEPCLPEKNHKKVRNGNAGEQIPNNIKECTPKSDDTAVSNNSKSSKKSQLDQITLPRTILFDINQIGRGEFGIVSVAKVKNSDLKQYLHKDTLATFSVTNEHEKRKSKTSLEDINEIKEDTDNSDDIKYALIKALNKVKDENVCIEFRRQIDMFRAISHKNVVKLFGLCRDKDPHYLVLEHTDLGDLKQYILSQSNTSNGIPNKNCLNEQQNDSTNAITNGKPMPIKLPQLLSIAHQISRGMDAIYRARYIHKDLAVRNCIISSDLTVKISYPAIFKEKYNTEYYKHKNMTIPLRWMAPECFQEDDCTIKSDVYSFGVLVWELLTFCAQLPLENLSNEEFLRQLQANEIEWELSKNVPKELTAILISCWKMNPKERPSFSSLSSAISKSLQQHQSTKS